MNDPYQLIADAVTNNKVIRIQAYSVSDEVEHRVQYTLDLILRKHHRPDLTAPIYTCIKELLINAVKANFKNIYFEDYTPKNQADRIINYNVALKLFKLEMSRENAHHLERLARDEDMKAEIVFQMTDEKLHVIVTNPATMTDLEKQNVEKKLRAARECFDIGDYFQKYDDSEEDEGAGLGIILISIMLRNMGVTERDFFILSEKGNTTASIKIPLSHLAPANH